jgi:ribosomal protein L37AE/L43A
MAIRKHSKISDAIVFKYMYTCPNCNNTYVSCREHRNKKCSKCKTNMVLSSTTTE